MTTRLTATRHLLFTLMLPNPALANRRQNGSRQSPRTARRKDRRQGPRCSQDFKGHGPASTQKNSASATGAVLV